MVTREALLELARAGYASGLEWRLRGSRDGAESVAMLVAEGLKVGDFRFKAERARLGSGVPGLVVRAEGATGGGSIGIVVFLEGPGGTVWLKVPPHRGAASQGAWHPDNNGRLFAHYLHTLRQEYERLAYASTSGTLEARSILEEASQQVAVAEVSYVGVGSTCRRALISLADEVYRPGMLPQGAQPPRGDDATTKLRYAVRRWLAGSSERYREGVEAVVKGTWDIAVALSHRRAASREEAEVCVDQTSVLIETVARLSLEKRPHD
jgi:hypothetical protein